MTQIIQADRDAALKLCPFCGEKAYCAVWTVDDDLAEPEDQVPTSWGVNCSCTASVGPWATEAEARSAWNTRASTSTLSTPGEGDWENLIEQAARRPCETKGAEDMEAGCCSPCRARTLLASLSPSPAEDSEKGEVELIIAEEIESCYQAGLEPGVGIIRVWEMLRGVPKAVHRRLASLPLGTGGMMK